MKPIPDYGDLMTIEEFLGRVESGMFIDYDGYGHWATSTHIISDEDVYPSMCKEKRIGKSGLKTAIAPSGATHVVWFNR